MLNKNPETFSIIDFELPKLQGENLDEHFKSISQDQSKVYFELLSTLVKNDLPPKYMVNFLSSDMLVKLGRFYA